jgi:hypothetical protein
MDVSLELINCPMKKCCVREYILNSKFGSAFDNWIAMGSIPPNDEDIEYLKHISLPGRMVNSVEVENETLLISAVLEPLEVRYIEILLE